VAIVTKKTSSSQRKLRIIGGRFRGHKFIFPEIEGLRPTPDRIRETLFNWLSPIIHVAKLYRKSLVKLRESELARLRKELTEKEYKSLKSAIALLKRNEEFVTKEECKILEPLFKYSPSLNVAYKLCCQLTGIYNSHIGKRKARNKISDWINKVEGSGLNCFEQFIKTLKKYKTEIIGYFKGRNTSGFVEGFNNKVKVLKRRCYGIYNENSLFRRLFLDCSGYDRFLMPQGLQPI